jgi:hypothetical protein
VIQEVIITVKTPEELSRKVSRWCKVERIREGGEYHIKQFLQVQSYLECIWLFLIALFKIAKDWKLSISKRPV